MKRYMWLFPMLYIVGVGVVIAADVAVTPRVVDTKAESVVREVPGAVTVDTKPKPRAWAFVRTTESGTWKIVARSPSGKEQALAEVEVVVPAEKVGVISVRTSLGVEDEVKPEPVERITP